MMVLFVGIYSAQPLKQTCGGLIFPHVHILSCATKKDRHRLSVTVNDYLKKSSAIHSLLQRMKEESKIPQAHIYLD